MIDPRTLVPLDLDAIVESVRRTNRLVVAHEAVEHGGFGAEIAAAVQAAAFDFLDAPIERVGAPFAPVPFSPGARGRLPARQRRDPRRRAEGTRMRAAVLREYGRPLELVELPAPEISRPDELLLRIEGAGVCATDLHAIDGEMEPAGVSLPLVLGHENAGRVESVGDLVSTVAVGDAVIVYPPHSCGLCVPCRRGRDMHCERHQFTGLSVNGGFAEYLVVPERSVIKLPPGRGPGGRGAARRRRAHRVPRGQEGRAPRPARKHRRAARRGRRGPHRPAAAPRARVEHRDRRGPQRRAAATRAGARR